MRHSLTRLCGVIPLTLLLLSAGLAAAQDSNACTTAATNALSQLANVCGDSQANTACYGSESVTASFADGVTPAAFSQRGEHVDLDGVHALQTSVVDPTRGSYGVTLMDIRADLPTSLSQENVKLMAFGGVEVENRVAPDAIFRPGHTFDATLATATDLHVAPMATSDIVTSLPAQSNVNLDAISADGGWVRAVYQTQPGWISKTALNSSADTSALAPMSADSFTPMQSFHLQNPTASPCASVPSFLLAQGPENASVNLRVQDVPLRIDSTVVMRVLPSGTCGQLELTTVYGLATLYPDTASPVYVPPGYSTSAPIPCASGSADSATPLTSANWTAPEPIAQVTLEDLSLVDKLPGSLLNYAVQLPLVVRASGRSVVAFINFPDPNAVTAAQKLCARGTLAENICRTLGV